MWLGILGDHIIDSEFIEENVNANYYANFLRDRLNELFENVPLANRLQLIFQQDGYPAHISRLARAVLNKKISQRWIELYSPHEWPSRSLDLTLRFSRMEFLKK